MLSSFFTIRDSGLLWAMIFGCLLRTLPLLLWPDWGCVRDECTYLNIAERMGSGLGMTSSSGWLWAPGYPFLLQLHDLAMGDPKLIKGVQVVLSLLVIIGLFRLGQRLSGLRAARLTAWLYALSPTQIFFSQSLWPETFYAALLLLGVFSFLRLLERPDCWRRAIALGLIMGAMALLRGVALLLIPIFIVCFWRLGTSGSRLWRGTFFMGLGATLMIAPYSTYASLKFKRLIVVDRTMGQMMWLGNNDFEPIEFDYGGQLTPKSLDEHTALQRSGLALINSQGLRIQGVSNGDHLLLSVPQRSGGPTEPLRIRFVSSLECSSVKSKSILVSLATDNLSNAVRLTKAINGANSPDEINYCGLHRPELIEEGPFGLEARLVPVDDGWGIGLQCLQPGSHCNDAFLETANPSLSSGDKRQFFTGGVGRNQYPPRPFVEGIGDVKKWSALNDWAMQKEDAGVSEGLEWIVANPKIFIARVPNRLSQMLNPHSFLSRHLRLGGWEGMPQWLDELLVLQTVAWSFLLTLGGALAILMRWKDAFFQLLAGIAGAHMIAISCFAGLSRYRVPIEPLLMLAFAIWITEKKQDKRSIFLKALILLSVLPLLLWRLPAGWPGWGEW